MADFRDDDDVDDIAMQVRCVFCHREQYAMVVYAVSLGEAPCAFCGETSEPMSLAEYRKAVGDNARSRQ